MTTSPSRCTAHDAHSPSLQARLVPVRPRSSRSTSASDAARVGQQLVRHPVDVKGDGDLAHVAPPPFDPSDSRSTTSSTSSRSANSFSRSAPTHCSAHHWYRSSWRSAAEDLDRRAVVVGERDVQRRHARREPCQARVRLDALGGHAVADQDHVGRARQPVADASAAACSTAPMSVARPSGSRSTRSTTSSTSASTPSGLISLSSSSNAITA